MIQHITRSLKERYPQQRLSNEFSQNIAVGAITAPACASKQAFDIQCFENAAPPQIHIAVDVTLIATSPAAALDSSTRSIVVSRGVSR